MTLAINCYTVSLEKYRTIGLPKFLLEMSSACSNAGLKMLTPLFDRFVNDRLLELFPLFDHGVTAADPRVTNPVVVDTLLKFPPKYGYSGQDCWHATLLLKFDLLPKIPCCFNLLMLNVYANCVIMTSLQ